MKYNKFSHELPLISFSVFQGITTGLFFSIFIYSILRGPLTFKGIYLTIFLLSVITLLISMFHLGHKQISYKSVNNLKSSWISREIFFYIVFSIDILLIYLTSEIYSLNKIFIYLGIPAALISLFSSGDNGLPRTFSG